MAEEEALGLQLASGCTKAAIGDEKKDGESGARCVDVVCRFADLLSAWTRAWNAAARVVATCRPTVDTARGLRDVAATSAAGSDGSSPLSSLVKPGDLLVRQQMATGTLRDCLSVARGCARDVAALVEECAARVQRLPVEGNDWTHSPAGVELMSLMERRLCTMLDDLVLKVRGFATGTCMSLTPAIRKSQPSLPVLDWLQETLVDKLERDAHDSKSLFAVQQVWSAANFHDDDRTKDETRVMNTLLGAP